MKQMILIVAMAATLTQAFANPLYNSCKGCHGMKGEKVAMGKSKVISSMKSEEIVKALTGYKDGTYGGALKTMMKGQAMRLTAKDIKTLSEYIPTLN